MSHDSGQAHIRDKRFDLAIAAKDFSNEKIFQFTALQWNGKRIFANKTGDIRLQIW